MVQQTSDRYQGSRDSSKIYIGLIIMQHNCNRPTWIRVEGALLTRAPSAYPYTLDDASCNT